MAEEGPGSEEPLMEFELIGHSKQARGGRTALGDALAMRTRSPRHDPAPESVVRAADGTPHSLAEFRGQNVVLHIFDPNEASASREARALEKHLADFQALNAKVIGIAPAGLRAQSRFAKKNKIHFMMLSDKDRSVIEPLAARGNTTVVIDQDGRVDKVFQARGRADRDTERVLRHLRAVDEKEHWEPTGAPPE